MESALKKLVVSLGLMIATPAFAQRQPEPLPYPPAVPAPQDTAWPGQVKLTVDITDLERHIINVHEQIPVAKSGDVILLYPEWVPGDHGPTGPLADLAGLVVRAQGHELNWVRDTVNVHAFHIPVPEGASMLDIAFQYLSPPTTREGRVEMTPEMVDLAWNTVALYPAGTFSRGITFVPTLIFPKSWHYATAL